jgi:hypothetical protein
MRHVITKTEDHEPSSIGAYAVEIFYSASLGASIAGTLVAALASSLTFEGLRKSSSEIGIRSEYFPFAATILSAVVGLGLIFILARTFYKNRLHSRARLTERVRVLEKSLFETAERDFDALVAAHGRR